MAQRRHHEDQDDEPEQESPLRPGDLPGRRLPRDALAARALPVPPAEPGQQDRDEDQVEQVVEGLRREIVLADPVAKAEQQGGEPPGSPADPQCPGRQHERHEQQEIDYRRPPGHQRQQAVHSSRPGDERDQREKSRPAEVSRQVRRDAAVLGDIVHETGDLVRRGESRQRLDEPGHAVQAEDQRDQQRLSTGGYGRRSASIATKGDNEHGQPGQRGEREHGDQAETVHRAEGDPAQRQQEEQQPARRHGRDQGGPPPGAAAVRGTIPRRPGGERLLSRRDLLRHRRHAASPRNPM